MHTRMYGWPRRRYGLEAGEDSTRAAIERAKARCLLSMSVRMMHACKGGAGGGGTDGRADGRTGGQMDARTHTCTHGPVQTHRRMDERTRTQMEARTHGRTGGLMDVSCVSCMRVRTVCVVCCVLCVVWCVVAWRCAAVCGGAWRRVTAALCVRAHVRVFWVGPGSTFGLRAQAAT